LLYIYFTHNSDVLLAKQARMVTITSQFHMAVQYTAAQERKQ